jgi:hypothetical protein
MECVYFGNCKGWGNGAGNGPWVMADLENGLWAGDQKVCTLQARARIGVLTLGLARSSV